MATDTKAQDPWHFPRADFAEAVVGMFKVSSAQRLYSPRRTGKTHFVSHDLIPEARRAGYHTIYIDLWNNASDSAQTLANGFRRAFEELTVSDNRAGRTLNQQVRGVRALGFGVDLGEVIGRTPPPDALSQIAFWLDAVVKESDKPLFVVFDEAQQIALSNDAFEVAAALRAALQVHGFGVAQFFTGSSQDHLARMFADANAPFYQYGQQQTLPTLERDFVDHIADMFERTATQLSLDREALWDAFVTLDQKPGPFREMTTKMLFARSCDVADYLASQLRAEDERALNLLESKALTPIELGVAARVAHGMTTTGRAARLYYASLTDQPGKEVHIATVQRALKRLRDTGLIYRTEASGDYRMTASAVLRLVQARIPRDAAGKD